MPRIRNKNKFVPADSVTLTNGDIVRIIPKPLNTEFVCVEVSIRNIFTLLYGLLIVRTQGIFMTG